MATPQRVQKKPGMRSRVARTLAGVFLFSAIILGIFNASGVADSYIAKLIPKFPWKISTSKLNVPYRLGLDIRGGTHLVYRADLAAIEKGGESEALESLRDVIERRVNLFGVAEPLVQIERSGGESKLVVELAGITDVNMAIRLIGETPFLEFREARPEGASTVLLEAQKKGLELNEDPYFVPTRLNGRHVKKATLTFDRTTSKPVIGLELTDEGGKIFAELTSRNIGKQIAIYLDGAPISAPVVQETINDGKAQITGNFTPASAKELVGRLNAGALPVPIMLIGQQTIGASLGDESLGKMLYAGLIGFLAIATFMVFWYRLPGLLAIIALSLYIGIVLAIFKLLPVTLTIAGIAGLILSVGMAVDANILIFERTKEELKKGKAVEEAISEGFARAWTSIRDSNVSSLITSAILYWFGSSIVKGFALTLGIGILVSMFSAISVTRTLLFAILPRRAERLKVLFTGGLSRS